MICELYFNKTVTKKEMQARLAYNTQARIKAEQRKTQADGRCHKGLCRTTLATKGC